MRILACVLAGLGTIAYVVALFFIGAPEGETFSDVGNALLLFAILFLLLRMERLHAGNKQE